MHGSSEPLKDQQVQTQLDNRNELLKFYGTLPNEFGLPSCNRNTNINSVVMMRF